MKQASRLSLFLGSITFVIASCGGGSDTDTVNGAIQGLSMPDAMDLVGVDAQTAGAAIAPGATVNPAVNFAANSDYNTDLVNAYMWDQTTEPLTTINDILTSVGQTKADVFVNTGPYLALVEAVGGGDPSARADSGQSSAANATVLEPWILKSTRASTTAPQIVRFWISQEENFGPDMVIQDTIYGRASVSKEPSAADPYGDFSMDFAMVNDADGSMMMKGALKTTNPAGPDLGFTFIMQDVSGMMGGDTKVAVQTDQTQTTGKAHMSVPDFMNGGVKDFTIAYDQNYFLRSDGTTTQLLDRNNFVRNTWGYNLYWAEDGPGHTAGQRVDIQGGFPFSYTVGNSTEFGWVDYWGIWSPTPQNLTSGTTVTRDLPDGTQASYTVLRAPGRLMKITKRSVPLLDLDGESMEYWDWTTGDQYLVQYTAATDTFTEIAIRDQITWEWNTLTVPVDLAITPFQYYNFWSEALGGSLDYIGGETAMTVREQTIVSNDDTIFNGGNSLTLYSMTDNLRAGMTASQVEIGDIFMLEVTDPALAYQYTFLKDGRSLQYQGADVGLLPGEVPTLGSYMWGMQSGPMSATDPVALGITNSWEMWNLNEYYIYETGHNEWNQYTTLLDSQGAPVQFDSPISFFYTHATANDADGNSTYDGKKVFLTYGGERNLWGIPGQDTDTDGDGIGDRWYPQFSLKDGTVMGPTGTEYVVKAVEMELFMQVSPDPIPSALQSDLSAAASLTLPNMNGWVDPTTVAPPTVADQPAVVAGIIQ